MAKAMASVVWLLVCMPVPSARSNFVGDSYLSIEQPLDHGCTGDSCATFSQQLVLINDTGYEPGGPVVLFLGGAASMYNFQTRLSFFVHNSHVLESAFVLLEHRFYGDSVPSETDALSVENLAYLTVDQVLADVESAIDELSHKHFPADTVFVLVGEAYSASLAAWYSQAVRIPHQKSTTSKVTAVHSTCSRGLPCIRYLV